MHPYRLDGVYVDFVMDEGEEKTREYLQRAGFRSIERHRLPHDLQDNWYVVWK